MSDDKVHIRDLMVATLENLRKNGEVPNVTLCGEADPNMNRLTFGDPDAVLRRKIKNSCERCINAWNKEAESDSNYKRQFNKFRKIIHKAIRGYR